MCVATAAIGCARSHRVLHCIQNNMNVCHMFGFDQQPKIVAEFPIGFQIRICNLNLNACAELTNSVSCFVDEQNVVF